MKSSTLGSPRFASRSSPSDALGIALFISLAIHLSAILVGSVIVHEHRPRHQELLFVHLIDISRQETMSSKELETAPTKEKPKAPPALINKPAAKPIPAISPAPAPSKEESAKTVGAKLAPLARMDPPSFASGSTAEGGGSAPGTQNLFGTGDTGVVSGAGNFGGGGTAPSGLGRGSGPPELPAQSVLRTSREAKPIQTARANYPPMALRAGLESDVTLKIQVDPQGNVTRAEITKSGGGSFDEEALRAVKQSRFEPAQRDGEHVMAEFTYIYRFRLSR
jgi:TonB family protein